MLVDKGPLYLALQKLAHIALGEPSQPIGCVRLEAKGDTLELTATDLTTWLRIKMPCHGEFTATLPVKALLEFARPINKSDRCAPVEFMTVENLQVVVAVEGAMITLPGILPVEFPDAPYVLTQSFGAEGRTWDASDAKNALGWVARAVSKNPTRPQICGVLFDDDRVVATDGHRLHIADFHGFGSPLLLPASSVSVLLRCLSESQRVSVAIIGKYACIKAENWQLAVRPMEERFPTYSSVVPKQSEQLSTFKVKRAAMKTLLTKLPRSTDSVRLNVNGTLEAYADSGNDNVPTAVSNTALLEHLGPDIHVRADPRYIKDAIAVGDDVVVGRFGGDHQLLSLEPAPGRLAIVMLQRN